jgi:hypothetical protein
VSVTVEQMQAEGWYRIFYKHHGEDYRWREYEMTAMLCDVIDGRLVLSLRPEAGTTEVAAADLLDAYQALPAPELPKRVQGGRTGASS